MLYTSSFVDDIMFSHNGTKIQIQAWNLEHSILFTATHQVALLNYEPGSKVCHCRLPCLAVEYAK